MPEVQSSIITVDKNAWDAENLISNASDAGSSTDSAYKKETRCNDRNCGTIPYYSVQDVSYHTG